MTTFGVTSTGFVKKTYADIVEDELAAARGQFGVTVDLTVTSPLYQFLCTVAEQKAALWDLMEDIYYSGFVNYATGTSLDELALVIGITRLPAIHATGTVTFSAYGAVTNPLLIPAGVVVENADGSVQFETTGAATIAIGQVTADAPIRAIIGGIAGNLSAGMINALVSTRNGIKSVANTNASTGGVNVESDAALRARIVTYTPSPKATVLAIENAIRAVTGVVTVFVIENTGTHTAECYVVGGADGAIEAAIEATRPCGIVVTLVRPDEVPIAVTVTVLKDALYTAEVVEANIETALATYFEGMTISGDIDYSVLIRVLTTVDGVVNVNVLTATDGTATIDALGESLTVADTKIATNGTHVITVA